MQERVELYFLEGELLLRLVSDRYFEHVHVGSDSLLREANCLSGNRLDSRGHLLHHCLVRLRNHLLLLSQFLHLSLDRRQLFSQGLIGRLTSGVALCFLLGVVYQFYVSEGVLVGFDLIQHVFMRPVVFLTQLQQDLLVG